MSTFWLMQRVRIVRAKAYPFLVGREGTIVRFGDHPAACPYYVRTDGFTCNSNDGALGAYEFNIEPLLDKPETVEWSECLWMPDHLRSEVAA